MKTIQKIAEALASGPTKLTDEGLIRFLAAQQKSINPNRQTKIYLKAALLALEIRGLK